MNHEIFFKRFRLLRTLAVGRQEAFGWCADAGASCRVQAPEAFLADTPAPPPHLLLLDFGALPESKEARRDFIERLKRLGHWHGVLFHASEEREAARDFALTLHFFGAYSHPQTAEEAIRALSAVVPPLLERLQEHSRYQQLQRIVEAAPPLALVGGRQVLFVNGPLKRLFGVKEAKAFETEVLPRLAESGLPEDQEAGLLMDEGRKILVRRNAEGGREALLAFCPLPPELNVEPKRFLSRVEFIDRLKDAMAQRVDPDEPLTVMMVKLGNFKQVVRDFGWLSAHSVAKEFGEALTRQFPAIDQYGMWSCDMVVAILPKEPLEGLKGRVKRFLSELQIMEFGPNVVLSADFVLIDVKSDDLGAMVNLLSKAYEEDLSVTDTAGFGVYETGTSGESPDESRLLRQFLTNIMANQLPVKLLNIYKGLPISTPTKILKMEEEKVVVTAEKIQKFVMEIEKKVVIQSPHLPGDVEAEVHFTDPARPLAIIKNLRMLHSSINNRKHTRVTVTSRLPIVLTMGRQQFTGYVADFSISSVAVAFKPGRFAENALKDREVRASFRLPWDNDEGSVAIDVEAKVLFNRDEGEIHKVVLLLEPDDVSESYMFDYIYKRQKELIKEIKNRIG
ncbi:diguanylate cyclase domain-containing protein [Hydrogenimonas sp.]